MAKGPGVSATSRIIAQSQTNIHYYSDRPIQKQQKFIDFHKDFHGPSVIEAVRSR